MEKIKKNKRKISWILLLFLLLFLITFVIYSLNSSVQAKGYYYCKLTSKGYEIVGLKENIPEEIVIPDNFDNTPVVAVANSVCTNLPVKSITIPLSVNSIGDKAFNNINSLVIIMKDRKNADGMKLGKNWSGEATVLFDKAVAIDELEEKLPEYIVEVIADKPSAGKDDTNGVYVPPIQPDTPDFEQPQKGEQDSNNNTVTNKTPNGGYQISDDNKKVIITLTSITIDTPPNKPKYVEGNLFDKTGMVISAHYSDNSSKVITDYVVTKLPLLTGTKLVMVSYTDNGITKNASQEVEIIKKIPTKLEIVTPPNKTRYIEGNVFEPSGMVAKISFDNSLDTDTSNFACPKEKLVLGQTSITISYKENGKEVTAIQPITVVAKTPTKLEITTPPNKTKYIEGNLFDKNGMVVKVTYDNGDTPNITNFIVPTDKLIKGETNITVSYKENGRKVTVNVPITVVAKTPIKLEITTPPNKTRYIEGNVFDKSGMVIKVTYDNGDTPNIAGFTVPTDKLIKGATHVTVSYKENDKEVAAVQPIIVVAKTPTKLEVTKQPTKTNYSAGLIFRPDGMIVTATYDNGDVNKNVTGYTYPAEQLKEGQTVFKISYSENGKPVTVDIAIVVGPQLAVYQKYNCVLDTCANCSGHGKITSTGTCSNCGGRGSYSSSETCSGCGGSGQLYYTCPTCGGSGTQHWTGADGKTGSHTCTSCGGSGGGYKTHSWCGGSGSVTKTHSCGSCGGSGSRTTTVTCSTCRGTGSHGYKKITYLSDVTVVANSLPSAGRHTDGSWYVLKHLIQDEIPKKKDDD